MDNYNPEVLKIIRWGSLGIIACRIATRLGITPLQALKDFFRSETCRKFHDRSTGLYLYGDYYIADNYLIEIGAYDEKSGT